MSSLINPSTPTGCLVTNTNTKLQGYYRSKLYSSTCASNPVIAAASPILSLIERIASSTTLPEVDLMRNNVEHEINAFQCRLKSQKYPDELSLIGRYIICATIDELLGKNYQRVNGKVADFKAFTPISSDGREPQTMFFQLLEQLKESVGQYLDLLELTYFCLMAGFEGEMHLRADGRQKLENLIEELYQLISENRVHKPLKLFSAKPCPAPVKSYKIPLVITSALVTISLVVAIGFTSHSILEYKAQKVLKEYIKVAHG